MAGFAQKPELFAGDLFHASAEGHLAFARVGAPMVDRLVEILEESRDERAMTTGCYRLCARKWRIIEETVPIAPVLAPSGMMRSA